VKAPGRSSRAADRSACGPSAACRADPHRSRFS
jgi:hypothetical protein